MNKEQKREYEILAECMTLRYGEEWHRDKEVKRTIKKAAKRAAKNKNKEVFYN